MYLNDYISATGGEGGDVLQPRGQLHADVREDTRVVGQYMDSPELLESNSDTDANLDVPQYCTGNHMANISTSVSC